MYTDDDLLPISALQHLLFCERQTALIHTERVWVENRFTAEGRVLHKKADSAKSETRDGVRITRGLPVHSFQLGLSGVCDVVQFQPPDFKTLPKTSLAKRVEQQLRLTRGRRPGSSDEIRTVQPGLQSQAEQREVSAFAHWTIIPVEYKRGRPKTNDCDRVQLCAQAMCLEEMLQTEIPVGHLFYGRQQRRTEVVFDAELRQITKDTSRRLHQLIETQLTPPAVKEKKCETCSLLTVCIPQSAGQSTASEYVKKMIHS